MRELTRPSYLDFARLTGEALRAAEADMLRRLARGALALSDCDDKGAYTARLCALNSLQERGWIDAARQLTERGRFALEVVGDE